MGKLSFQVKICILSCWALLLMCSVASREYFHQDQTLPWDNARNHCQVCFKDLVTLTPDNIQAIAKDLTSDYWIGLRKSFSNSTGNSTSNSSMHWTHWANKDPLTFQNWYPGWPKIARVYGCRCSCIYSKMTTSHMTSAPSTMTTRTPYSEVTTSYDTSAPSTMTSEAPYSEMTTSDDPSAPFAITLEAPYSEMTTSYDTSAPSTMTSETPRSEMTTSDKTSAPPPMSTQTSEEATCNSDIIPLVLNIDEDNDEDSCVAMLSFGAWVVRNCSEPLRFICYEDPFIGKVNVTDLTSTSVSFTWLEAPGDISHYRVEIQGDKNLTANATDMMHVFENLTEGTPYVIKVFPVKCGRDLNPQQRHIHTLPNKIKSIDVVKVTETSVFLNWSKPDGNVEFYQVEYLDKHLNISTAPTNITNLIPGSRYTFKVYSGIDKDNPKLSKATDRATYTKPGKVTNLKVSDSTKHSMLLQWDPPEGVYTGFWVMAVNHTKEPLLTDKKEINVTGLPTCTEITLSVVALANDTVEGDKVTVVSYTVPRPPTNPNVTNLNATHVNFTWTAPNNTATAKYRVIVNSSFWGQNWTVSVKDETSIILGPLKSGTKYDFEVRTSAESLSEPASEIHYTVADFREITLSMMCSSKESLLCDRNGTKKHVFEELTQHFHSVLGDNINWTLARMTGNSGTIET
ncbi:receptor-type tyrosine-protein phosphatase H-like isoform X2 [Thunnus maccoyii]|uniref:receptor-type tyrosine-protein phosphatase H-like isoform X2 n=1 Tax=Thunnus maccoyii TaxID=8240 RepID=UPI001C4DAF3E|nr:receptor-type tyrosine-protein phosphatase H-like isoform X2 [Thunnus maccoyii]